MAGTTGRQISRRAGLTTWTARSSTGAQTVGFPDSTSGGGQYRHWGRCPWVWGAGRREGGRRHRTQVSVDAVLGAVTPPPRPRPTPAPPPPPPPLSPSPPPR